MGGIGGVDLWASARRECQECGPEFLPWLSKLQSNTIVKGESLISQKVNGANVGVLVGF